MTNSIISNEKRCLVCGTTQNLHKHHIYGGVGRRNLSEKWGCWVWLCAVHHNASNKGVHFNKDLDLKLKQDFQEILEEKYNMPREFFIQQFGKSYRG